MEQPKPNPTSVAIKWSLTNVATAIVLTYVFQFTNVGVASPIRYISLIPSVAFLFLAQKEYKDQLGGYLKFGEGFSIAWRIGVFSGIILAVFVYLYYGILSPDMYTKYLEAQRAALEASGASSDKVDQSMEIMNKLGLFFLVIGSLIGAIVGSIIFGLIGAAIFKRERSAFDPEPVDPTV